MINARWGYFSKRDSDLMNRRNMMPLPRGQFYFGWVRVWRGRRLVLIGDDILWYWAIPAVLLLIFLAGVWVGVVL